MGGPRGYDIIEYGQMVTSEPRMSAYAEALRRAITPGCTVIDIGAGTGIFSLLACQYGAGSVVAIEPDAAIQLLHEAAAANGFTEKISVIQGMSTDYRPSKKADVVVSDLRGGLPLYEGHIRTITDARDRLLTQGGTLIPQRDVMQIALVQNPEQYRHIEQPWAENRFGLDLSCGRRYAANTYGKAEVTHEDLRSDVQQLAVADYRVITDPELSASVTLSVKGNGPVHGYLVWFDAELADGIGFSNAPGEPRLIYGQTFFPFERVLSLSPNDRVEATISAKIVDGRYIWSWSGTVLGSSADTARLSFRQSGFLSRPLSKNSLSRRSAEFVPPPSEDHQIDLFCLSRIDGERSLGQIASELATKFPDRFGSENAALNHVAALAGRY